VVGVSDLLVSARDDLLGLSSSPV